jgi:hypothetical protein
MIYGTGEHASRNESRLKAKTPRFTGRNGHLRRRHEQDRQSDVRGPQAPDGHRFVAPPQRLSQLAISAAAQQRQEVL